jgi:hypothetical protein
MKYSSANLFTEHSIAHGIAYQSGILPRPRAKLVPQARSSTYCFSLRTMRTVQRSC